MALWLRFKVIPPAATRSLVRSSKDEFLAYAAYSPQSQIIARVWSWDEDETIDKNFFARRIVKSIESRSSLSAITNAMRWVNAESDGIPGLVVDRYAQFAVCQFLTAGVEKWKSEIADVLMAQEESLACMNAPMWMCVRRKGCNNR